MKIHRDPGKEPPVKQGVRHRLTSFVRQHWVLTILTGTASAVLAGLILYPIYAPDGDVEKDDDEAGQEVATSGALPFRVTGTASLGLFIRTCPDEDCGCSGADCEKLGAAGEDTIVWVECQTESGYVPTGVAPGPWYRVRWSRDDGGTREIGAGISSPDAPYKAWAHSSYLVAVDKANVQGC